MFTFELHHSLSLSFSTENKAIGVMKPGHTFTIEPMISEGTWRDVTWPDDWTAVTQVGQKPNVVVAMEVLWVMQHVHASMMSW